VAGERPDQLLIAAHTLVATLLDSAELLDSHG
jgi:hypothetical protein